MAASQPPVTFVCCIESGPLEHEVVRLVQSLRQWGGRFADCPVLAIKPRLGPPPGKATLRALAAAGATYLSVHARQRYGWFHYMNKAICLEAAEAHAGSEQLVWLDSDILVLGDPDAFELADGEDFAFVAGSRHGGTTGPDDPGEALWRAMCETTGLAIDDLPWIHNEMDGESVRFYFNVGAFGVRRNAGLGPAYRGTLDALLDAHIRCHERGLDLIEQAAVGMAVLRTGLRWRQRPYIYNYHVGPGLEPYHKPELFEQARLLHYHRAMRPEDWPKLLGLLRESHPEVHDWLAPQGPILYGPRLDGWRAASRSLLRAVGRVQRKRHEAQCRTL